MVSLPSVFPGWRCVSGLYRHAPPRYPLSVSPSGKRDRSAPPQAPPIRRTLTDLGWRPESGPDTAPRRGRGRHALGSRRPSPGPGVVRRGPGRRHGARRALILVVALLVLVVPATGVLGLHWFSPDGKSLIGTAFGGGQGGGGGGHPASGTRSRPSRAPSPIAASPSPTPVKPSPTHSVASPTHSATPSAPASSAAPAGGDVDPAVLSIENQVATMINQQRASAGCGALRYDARLATAARKHSADMARRGYFDHNTPDGVTPWDRAKAEGYADPSAENIAAGQQSAADAVQAWMNSPGHRANILNCDSHATGVGFARGGSYGYYWTELFGYE